MPKFVERDPTQQYLLPPDTGDWVPGDELVHFVLEAVERVFGIVNKGMGFRRLLLQGLGKVEGERALVTLGFD